MTRWDHILALPVQEPSTIEFSSSDLNWSKVESWYQNFDDVALIPSSRVEDFVKGECSRAECPTIFRERRRKKAEGSSYKPRVDGHSKHTVYWCCYGPDDRRKGGTFRPSRKSIKPSKKKRAGRPHTKRGCICHFTVKCLSAKPSVALVIYNERRHVDNTGSPCHGPLDVKAIGTRFVYASYNSKELRLRITSMIYAGFSVDSIIQKHMEAIERDGGHSNSDDRRFRNYVRKLEKLERGIEQSYELDSGYAVNDAVSFERWVENHRSKVFYYQGSSDTDAFILGIQTEWQLQQMIRFGNNNLLAVDSSFGVKKFKYPVYTLLVFDSNQIAIPIAWIISPSLSSHDFHKWMRKLHDRVCAKDSLWRLNGFIVDDPSTETAKISDVFQCPILLCHWHLRHAWHRNIIKKCTDSEMQREMLKRLGNIMYSARGGSDVRDAMVHFKEDFKDHSAFLEYLEAKWMPKIEMWVTAMRNLPLASQETCAAIEAFHSNLKSKMFNREGTGAYERIDWLVHKLTTKVHSYYWFDHFLEENDLCPYKIGELASNSRHRALEIDDRDVILNDNDIQFAEVVSQSDRSRTHTVWNPSTEFAICDCSWSMSGKLCKHVMKACMVFRDSQARRSVPMQTYYEVLESLLQCPPPDDSIALDHFMACATQMKQDLKTLLGPSNHRGTDPPLMLVKQDLKTLLGPSNHRGTDPLLMLVPASWGYKKNRTKRLTEAHKDKIRMPSSCSNSPTIRAT